MSGRRGRRGDDGNVLLLGVGCVALTMSLLLVCVDVASLALRRREAVLTADTAARAAAQALDLRAYYTAAPNGRLPLDPALARSRAAAAIQPPWRLESVDVVSGEVTVTVGTRVEFAVGSSLGLPSTWVHGTSAAVLRRS